MIQCDWCGTWREPHIDDQETQCPNACPTYPPGPEEWEQEAKKLLRLRVGYIDPDYDPQAAHERLAERNHERAVTRAAGLKGPHG